jgi:peptidoglycan/LPS O-acetylase OafA/YrhL
VATTLPAIPDPGHRGPGASDLAQSQPSSEAREPSEAEGTAAVGSAFDPLMNDSQPTTEVEPTATGLAEADFEGRSGNGLLGKVVGPIKTPAPTDPVAPSSERQRAPSARLAGVDGLRAFAALWVVLFHMRAFSGGRLPEPLDLFVRSGSTGVSLFLVLSGFCLYLPFAGANRRFHFGQFLTRRCRRLMPAYYASLAAIVLLYVIAGGHLGLPDLTTRDLTTQAVTHATLTHQLVPATFYGLNGAYWSLGLEWELYLTLPLLIIAVRRFGLACTLLGVVGVNVAYRLSLTTLIGHGSLAAHSILATDVLPNLLPGRWAEFAFGMAAAELYQAGRLPAWGRRLRYAVIPVLPAALLVAGNPLAHLLFGAVFVALLCTVVAGDNIVARVFSWGPMVLLGTMSFSIYLIHTPLVQIGATLLGADHGASPTTVFFELVALLPVILAVSWLLFMLVERRTLTTHSVPAFAGRSLLFPRWWPTARESIGTNP